MAKELLLEFKGFVNKDDINKSQFRIFGNIINFKKWDEERWYNFCP